MIHIKAGIRKKRDDRHRGPLASRAIFSGNRHALGLNGIALPAHVCAQFGPRDSGVGFNPEQPRLGAAPLAIGTNDDMAQFGGCQWHVLTIRANEVVSSNTFIAPQVT